MPRVTIADTVAEILAEHRALSLDELGRRVAAAGRTRAKDPVAAVRQAIGWDPRLRELYDGRWVLPAPLLDDVILTHRLTPEEATSGVLAVQPDLAPIFALDPDDLRPVEGAGFALLAGERAREATGIETHVALRGPDGWLGTAAPATLVHVRVAAGVLTVGPGPEPRPESRLPARALVEAVRARLAGQATTRLAHLPRAVTIESVVFDLLADGPGLLDRPLAPLSEVLAAAGLEVHRGFVGEPGTDWPAVDELFSFLEATDDDPDDETDGSGFDPAEEITRWDRARDVDAVLAERLDLDPEEVSRLRTVLGGLELRRQFGRPSRAEVNAGLARLLAWPGITRALAILAWTDPVMEPFIADLAAAAVGADAAPPAYVLGTCAEARDDIVAAERAYRAALDADPDFPPARIELARYETDRGDFTAALAHLVAARLPANDPERAWLEGWARPSVPKVGRNDPCPCGSGRKYKACHLGAPGAVAAVPMAKALQHKIDLWLSQPDLRDACDRVRREAVSGNTDDDDQQGPSVGLASDVVLFDRGGFRRFLDVRGPLLPPAERQLAESWLTGSRSLYEVEAIRPGVGLGLRDLRADGRRLDLTDRSLPRQVELLDLLCLRVVPDGSGGHVAFDGMLVPRPQRHYVMGLLDSGDGGALLRWATLGPPMPQMSNMEGEPIELTTIEYRLLDPAATAAALRRRLTDEGGGRFVEMVRRKGRDWMRGSVTIDGDRATIDTNSAKRAARLERTLLAAAPGARLLQRTSRSMEEAMAEGRAAGPAAEPVDLAAHPELAQAMEAFMRDAERAWVDERIPALGGVTPRQAVDHPTARRELDALLVDMAWQRAHATAQPGMDPARIRALLGISGPAAH